MQIGASFEQASLVLPAHGTLHFSGAEPARFTCEQGALWITLLNCPKDIILEPGDSFSLSRFQNALLAALNNGAQVRIERQERPKKKTLARRLAARWINLSRSPSARLAQKKATQELRDRGVI